jgi:Uncharacterised nucleotidyltransferase
MKFRLVMEKLMTAFHGEGIRYALMGGFALGLWGVGRSTVDLDILVERKDVGKVDRIMLDLGYECRYKSENVSQYVSALNIFGEVDFLHAFREASLDMLGRAEEKAIFGNELSVSVLRPEDLVGLKLQAIKNNPAREQSDAADIESLLLLQKENLDWQLIGKYFKLFEMEDLLKRIRGRIA